MRTSEVEDDSYLGKGKRIIDAGVLTGRRDFTASYIHGIKKNWNRSVAACLKKKKKN